MTVSVTAKLAQFVVDAGYDDIPDLAISRAKIMFLDTIGVALAGISVGETGRIAIEFIKDIGGTPEATVISADFRTSAPNAAFVNALLAHTLDFDDWEPSGHPSSTLVATSLALGEKLGLPGKAILMSYILGLEVYDKIASGCPSIIARGWQGTAIYGTMGATAVATKLLGLNLKQAIMAFGIAAAAASGMQCQFGTMTKSFQVGNAARHGIEAALLARNNFTSAEAIIERPAGFGECFLGLGACQYDKMTENLGNPFHIVFPGLGIKPYPCRYREFQAIEATLDLRREYGFSYQDIDLVEVRVPPSLFQGVQFSEPLTGLEAKFSLNYIVTLAILDGGLTPASFTDAKVRDPRVKEAMRKVRLIADKTIPSEWIKSWNLVIIRLKDGSTFSKKVDIPKGDPRNPLSEDEIMQKYRNNASFILTDKNIALSLKLLKNLEHIRHLEELTNILMRSS